MPMVLEAVRTFKVVLETDKEKEKNKRPYFEFRYLSGRKWRDVVDVADLISESKKGSEAIDRLFDVLRLGLAGWGNMIDPENKKSIAYDPKMLEDIITFPEANELLVKFRNQDFEADDRKN